jgi:hypothetical protein
VASSIRASARVVSSSLSVLFGLWYRLAPPLKVGVVAKLFGMSGSCGSSVECSQRSCR